MSVTLADSIDPTLVLLTVEEAARCLQIGRTVCYRLIRSGELESTSAGSPPTPYPNAPPASARSTALPPSRPSEEHK